MEYFSDVKLVRKCLVEFSCFMIIVLQVYEVKPINSGFCYLDSHLTGLLNHCCRWMFRPREMTWVIILADKMFYAIDIIILSS